MKIRTIIGVLLVFALVLGSTGIGAAVGPNSDESGPSVDKGQGVRFGWSDPDVPHSDGSGPSVDKGHGDRDSWSDPDGDGIFLPPQDMTCRE